MYLLHPTNTLSFALIYCCKIQVYLEFIKQQQQQQHLFKHDKNYSGADVVVYLRS